MEAEFHSSGSFTLDLYRGLGGLAGGVAVHGSEALAHLISAMRLWSPAAIEVNSRGQGWRVSALRVERWTDPLALIARNVLLPRSEVPPLVTRLAIGLRGLLALRGVEVCYCAPCGTLRQLSGSQEVAGQAGCSEFFLRGPMPLDIAWLRRRLRFFPLPITVNLEPLPLLGTVPSSPEFLWEAFDTAQPFAAEPFAGWSAGPARLDLGEQGHEQLREHRHRRVHVVGRFFGPAPYVAALRVQHPRPEWIFGSKVAAPQCGALCSLELKPRTRSRWVPVVDGWAGDSVEMPWYEPGWRVWLAAAHGFRLEQMQRRALDQLAWARQWMEAFAGQLRALRRELRC